MSRLEVICGPMFSGKTEELLRRLRREQIAGKKVLLVKPYLDTRYYEGFVTSHNGLKFDATSIGSSYELETVVEDHEVIGIDEAQFFDDMLGVYITSQLMENKKIIACGLDKDFTTEPFGPMPKLMIMADVLDKMTAICNKCGSEYGSFTQRLVDGKPAKFDGPTILVGGTESYEARCRQHFEIG
jgi:thymidine kinase